MFKKKLSLLALVVLFIFAVTSTGSAFFGLFGGGDDEAELTLWYHEFVTDWPGRDIVKDYFETNTKLNVRDDYGPPNYRDAEQQFITQGRTGTPDVIEGLFEHLHSYQEAGLIEPLNDFWAGYDESDQFPDSMIEPMKIDGEIYGIPYTNNVRLLLYRKSVLEEEGLDVPETWDELVETTAYISENVSDMQGFIFTTQSREVRAFQEFMSFYFQLNDIMFDVTGNEVELVATPQQLTQVLELYHDMYFEGGVDLNERGSDWQRTDYGFTAGDFAMTTVGPWIWGHRGEDQARADVLDDTGIAAVPVAENGQPATYAEIKPIMMNTYADDKEAAWDLIEEIVSKDYQALTNTLSGSLSARDDAMAANVIAGIEEEYPESAADWWLSGFGEYLDHGVALDPVSWDDAQYIIIDAIQNVIYEESTPQEAGQNLHSKLEDLNL